MTYAKLLEEYRDDSPYKLSRGGGENPTVSGSINGITYIKQLIIKLVKPSFIIPQLYIVEDMYVEYHDSSRIRKEVIYKNAKYDKLMDNLLMSNLSYNELMFVKHAIW